MLLQVSHLIGCYYRMLHCELLIIHTKLDGLGMYKERKQMESALLKEKQGVILRLHTFIL